MITSRLVSSHGNIYCLSLEGKFFCRSMATEQPSKVINVTCTPDSSSNSLPNLGAGKPEVPNLGAGKREMSILVLGKTKSGKSTLINAIFQKKVAKESFCATPVDPKNKVEEYEAISDEGVPLFIYDTRGLLDLCVSDKAIFDDAYKKCSKGFNLVLICIKMTDGVDQSMIDSLRKLEEYFSKDIWDRSVFVLTFANFFLLQGTVCDMPSEEKRTAIVKKIREVREKIKGRKIVPGSVFNNIPFVIAGYEKAKYLLDTINWLDELKNACNIQCKDENKALPRFLLFFSPHWRTTAYKIAGEIVFAYVGGYGGGYIGGYIGETIGKSVVNYVGFKAASYSASLLKEKYLEDDNAFQKRYEATIQNPGEENQDDEIDSI